MPINSIIPKIDTLKQSFGPSNFVYVRDCDLGCILKCFSFKIELK